MEREKKLLILLLAAILILEIPVVWLWHQAAKHRMLSVEQPIATTAQTEPETLPPPPETTLPKLPTVPAETMPVYTEPPKITIDTVPQYYMDDYPREPYGVSTVADSGSAMTALAMVASYLTDHPYYPDQMADWLAHFSGGHYQRLEYGSDLFQLPWIRAENVHKALEGVRQGKTAILLMRANSLFSWKEHFIVVTGINEAGLYTVLDPDRDNYDKESLASGFREGFREGLLISGYSAGWLYDKSAMPEEPFLYEPEPAPAESRYPGLTLTEEETQLLARLICREAESEPFAGQQAVAEVVLNRLASGRFGSSIDAIVHAEGQFPSVPYLYKAEPDYTQYKAIEQALNGPYVLPEDVVFYAKFKMNDNYWGQIGSHHFCYSYD